MNAWLLFFVLLNTFKQLHAGQWVYVICERSVGIGYVCELGVIRDNKLTFIKLMSSEERYWGLDGDQTSKFLITGEKVESLSYWDPDS